MKRTLLVLCLALCPGWLEAQQEDPIEVQVAVLAIAAQHAREIALVPAAEMVIAPRAELSPALERLAARLGTRFGTVEEVRCGGWNECRAAAGARAGFRLSTFEIGADSAVVGVDVWYLAPPGPPRPAGQEPPPGLGRLTGRADLLDLARSGADWKVVRVTRLVDR